MKYYCKNRQQNVLQKGLHKQGMHHPCCFHSHQCKSLCSKATDLYSPSSALFFQPKQLKNIQQNHKNVRSTSSKRRGKNHISPAQESKVFLILNTTSDITHKNVDTHKKKHVKILKTFHSYIFIKINKMTLYYLCKTLM